jgi:hypothetical protein
MIDMAKPLAGGLSQIHGRFGIRRDVTFVAAGRRAWQPWSHFFCGMVAV